MFKKWQIADKIKDEFREKFPEIDSLVLQLLHNRGIDTQDKIDEFLNPDYGEDLHDPFLFKDMRKAVDRILEAIKNNEKITIFGDYDADGVTSVVVLEKVFNELAGNIDVYIPHRGKEGYGLNEKALKVIKENGSSLIITVDCGVSNYDAIDYANDLGIDVIITDHHQPPEKLPNAFAIIDPKVSDEKYPFEDLAGVGVAFKLAQALTRGFTRIENGSSRIAWHSELDAEFRSRSRIKCGMTNENVAGQKAIWCHSHKGTIAPSPDQIKWLLDLVAVGTVADCSPLVGENRTLVKYGLIVLNKTRNLGLKAIMETAGLAKSEAQGVRCVEDATVNGWNIGFQIAPRLNAAGRLDHANTAYQLLTTESPEEAKEIAGSLNETNNNRQEMTKKATDEAKEIIEKDQKNNIVLFAKNNNWQAGIIGLVAGRISQRYYRPVFIFTKIEGKIVASGRSIPEFDITQALKQTEKYLKRYGGHSQACGLELKSEKIYDDFIKKFSEVAGKKLDGLDLTPLLHIDAEIKADTIDWEIYEQVKKIEPYGMGNPQSIFVIRNLQIMEVRIIGKDGKHLKLKLRGLDADSDADRSRKRGFMRHSEPAGEESRELAGGRKGFFAVAQNDAGRMVSPKIINAIGFSLNDKERAWGAKLKVGDFIDVVGHIDVNEWNGNRELQMKVVDLRFSKKGC